MSDYQPKFLPGQSIPVIAAATITGGQLVTTTGTVAGDAASNVLGVAAFDCVAGASLTTIRAGVHRLVASGAITNGQPLCAAANGTVRVFVTGTDALTAYLGTALSTAASGALVDAVLPLV